MEKNESHLCLCPDHYCEKDCLGFDQYIDVIGSMMRDEHFETPFCVGVLGKWGTGKTTFMRLLMESLRRGQGQTSGLNIAPVWFNPWRYDKEEHLIIPFLKTIEHDLNGFAKACGKDDGKLKRAKTAIKKGAEKIGRVASAMAYGMNAKAKLGPLGEVSFDGSKTIHRWYDLGEKKKKEAKQAADSSESFTSLYYDSMTHLKKAVDETSFRVVVFIDDLDRCLPEKVVELLESIKLFFDVKGYLFVMGLDKKVVEKGILYRYRHFQSDAGQTTTGARSGGKEVISPEDYLEKMIQLPIELPPVEPGKKMKYIQSLLSGQKAYMDHAILIELGVGENPRSLKRFVNLLAFTGRLAERIKEGLLNGDQDGAQNGNGERLDPVKRELLDRYFIPEFYIKWTIIVFRFHEVCKRIRGNRNFLFEIQNLARNGAGEGQADSGSDLESDAALKSEHTVEEGAAVKSDKTLTLEKSLKEVLLYGEPFPNDPWVIDHFVHLAQVTDISARGENARPGYRQDVKPGDMVKIPKGKFKYGEDKEEREMDHDYYIDAFPVTNQQYQRFIEDRDDYRAPDHWDKKTKKYPEGLDDHPVVWVSYDDAVAYCQWRSEKENMDFRLPTEEEWEKAARGEDGGNYPWGDEFDAERCNSEESGIQDTTPVTNYPNGISPYGLYDMAGNVLEWTDSWYDNGKDSKCLRGGGFWGDAAVVRCAFRSRYHPYYRNLSVGFRVVSPGP